jgi:hypothetical protein
VSIRDSMRESVSSFLRPDETVQTVIGAQTASQYVAALVGPFPFLGLNRYRILAITSQRILVLDAGKMSMKKARDVMAELPRETRLGPASGVWHTIPVNGGKVRVHRRFFKDIERADATATAP